MGDSLDPSDPPPEEQPVSIVDISEIVNYLKENVKLNLLGTKVAPPALNVAFEENNNIECIKKFAADSQIPTLLVQRTSAKGECLITN